MSSQSIMTEILEPNRIHTLPVQVSYHLPSTSQIFTTLLPSPQQVYVYPAAPSSSSASSSKEAEESWGSIYLKTVVQGVIMSSPEYLPLSSNPSTDLSLYTFDPRETYLRKSRATIHPPHLRRSAASSPLLASPDINNGPQQTQAGGEVWTGKGLVSKALEEPGLGKNLITGRLVRRKEFSVTHGNVDPLKALMQANEGGCWGIEVSLGLRNGQGHVQSFGLGQQSQSQFGSRSTSPMPMPMPTPQAIASGSSAPPMYARHSYPAVPQQSRRPTIPTSRTTSYLPPSSDRVTSSTPARPPPTRKPVTKKRPTPPPRHLSTVDTNSRAPTKTAAAGPGLPLDIPRHVYDNPDLLTKEQAERLIASPFFLNKLSEMTGQPLVPIVKREREDDTPQSSKKARAKQEEKQTCYNCGRVNNHVWRHMTLDDGSTTVTICNACGLYRNRHGVMRPPAMWDRVDEEIKPLRPPMPSSELDLPAQRLDSGFKRTMSSVVEKDAKRLASSSGRKPVATRAMPMTSPPRGSRSVSKSARHSASRVQQQPAASSPGPFNRGNRTPAHQPLQQAFVFNPDDSPNTTLNKIIGASMPMQSLDMPLSDDGREREGPQMPWTNKTNTNTNTNTNKQNQNHHNVNTPYQNNHDNRNNNNAIERFEMSAGPHGATSLKSPSPPPKFHRTSSTASRRFQHQHQHQPSGGTDEDDVLSQLFNRTSSIGPLGSSPAPFDFSQLPPSSPPASNGPSSDIDLELGHSAMLLSSPDISPASSHHTHKRISPEKKSNLNQSFTPDDLNLNHNIETKTGGGGQEPPSYDYDIEELWSKLQSQYDQQHQGGGGMESSGQIAEGLLGQMAQGGEEDFLALFNSLTNDNAH